MGSGSGSGTGSGAGVGSGSGHLGRIGIGLGFLHGFELEQQQDVSTFATALAGVSVDPIKEASKQKTIGMDKIDHATQSLVLWQIKSIKSVAKTPKSPCPGIRDQLRSYKS